MTTIDARTPLRPPAPDTRPYWERYKQASHFRSKEEEFDAVKIGIWLFLTTEVLLFAGLFCAYVVFLGHVALGSVIDTDHWRHFYLLIGLIWGAIALEYRYQRGFPLPPA